MPERCTSILAAENGIVIVDTEKQSEICQHNRIGEDITEIPYKVGGEYNGLYNRSTKAQVAIV